MSHRRIDFILGDSPPARLDKALARDVPEEANLSRTRLGRLIADGAVTLDGVKVQDPRAKVAEGQAVQITVEEAAESHILPEDIPLSVVFEDDDLIVIDKPAGMVVHPAPGSPSGTLVNALLAHCGDDLSGVGGMKRPGIVHRIDKDTTGLLVVAKSDAAHHGLAAQFEKHTVERYYQTLVYGVPDANDPRLRGVKGASFEAGNILRMTTQLARHKTARTVERFGTPPVLALLECWLETGRTHQIRVHMSHAGHGLVGDATYGGRRKLAKAALPEATAEAIRAFPRQALHAAVLGFAHPVTGENLRFEAPLPADMAALLQLLREGPASPSA